MAISKSETPRILITAGPTWEPMDPVRGILNRSSGKMGLALAQACHQSDLPVRVLLGPVEREMKMKISSVAHVSDYQTSRELEAMLQEHWPRHNILFMAAAVADLRPSVVSPTKLAREHMTLEFEPVPDLLKNLADKDPKHGTRIGFALEEPSQLIERARKKMSTKRCHAIAANPLSTIDSDQASGAWVTPLHSQPLGLSDKAGYARVLLDQALELHASRGG